MAIKDWLRQSAARQCSQRDADEPIEIVLSIGQMIGMHVDGVSRIEHVSFPDPWPNAAFRHVISSPHHSKLTAIIDGAIVGYAILATSPDSCELINLAVAPEYRRSRIGWRLIAHHARMLQINPRRSILAPVSERNRDAQEFFKSCGFDCISIASRWFSDGSDAYVFQYRLGQKPKARRELVASDDILSRSAYLGRPVTR